MLSVRHLEVRYGGYLALADVSLDVGAGEVACLLGANGSGKSSLLNAVSGLVRPAAGTVLYDGEPITEVPTYQLLGRGLAHVLERRRLFPFMTVQENLLLGAYLPALRGERAEALERVYALFPVLRERCKQLASTLSGGEQQMVAIARGMMADPRLLIFDEPSLGLSPLLVDQMFNVIRTVAEQGTTVLLVEQNVFHTLQIADRGYVLENGAITLTGTGKELLENPHVRRAYLGH